MTPTTIHRMDDNTDKLPTDWTEWFLLDHEREAVDQERLKWIAQREKKIIPECNELDEKLKRLDPERFAAFETASRRLGMILSAVHDGVIDFTDSDTKLDNEEDGFATEETAFYKHEMYKLCHDDLTMDIRPCKWRRRYELAEQWWHCSEEETKCEDKINDLEIKIRKVAPKEEPKTSGFVFDPSQLDYDQEQDPADEFYTAEMAEIDELHFEIDAIKEQAEWGTMSHERQLRKKDQALHEMQTLSLLEYIDQLEGLVREINADWKEDVKRLDAEGDLIGKQIDVYINGAHPRETFAIRCREDLGTTAKWRVVVKKKFGFNKYLVQQDFSPHKKYLMCLGKDKKNHIFAFSFLSTFGYDWADTETKLHDTGAISWSSIRGMSTQQRYKVHDQIKTAMGIAKAKKKARG